MAIITRNASHAIQAIPESTRGQRGKDGALPGGTVGSAQSMPVLSGVLVESVAMTGILLRSTIRVNEDGDFNPFRAWNVRFHRQNGAALTRPPFLPPII